MRIGETGGVGEESPLVEAKGSQWRGMLRSMGKAERVDVDEFGEN